MTPGFGQDEFETLEGLTSDLATKRGELGELLAAERRGRVMAFEESQPSDSVSSRERYADAVTLELAVDIINLKADIAAISTEWEFYMAWMRAAPGDGD